MLADLMTIKLSLTHLLINILRLKHSNRQQRPGAPPEYITLLVVHWISAYIARRRRALSTLVGEPRL